MSIEYKKMKQIKTYSNENNSELERLEDYNMSYNDVELYESIPKLNPINK